MHNEIHLEVRPCIKVHRLVWSSKPFAKIVDMGLTATIAKIATDWTDCRQQLAQMAVVSNFRAPIRWFCLKSLGGKSWNELQLGLR